MPDLIRHPVPAWIPAFAGMTTLMYLVAGVISFRYGRQPKSLSVESEFKKEYCHRKIDSLQSAVAHVVGTREIVIGEPPLVEQAREQQQHIQHGPSARILVVGVGDGGVNAVDRMRAEQLEGVRLIAVDTDHQVLEASHLTETLQLGLDITA